MKKLPERIRVPLVWLVAPGSLPALSKALALRRTGSSLPFAICCSPILAARRQDAGADTSKLEQAIDTKVFDLYGLTADERKLVMEPSN